LKTDIAEIFMICSC